ncbi:LPS export ABC transporter periplasmic protein LptC [Corticibacter populi]|uniref:LPS export ABC transporter periplasmic protein LptC n=1 Tax=Corticibacter populi TaxID=1550736 RepID=A0A3M6QMF6_9BURK|nr:LPS export ABC transporter periplasmic protein LptC [Corticibacter populi]RMX04268.1 LPS export ABC transporter periplasmic protein LptC [Corticibacter populi]RZS33311.1 lipopolysaccharide export system protein LptC [Corticibacter populi]
MNASLTAPSGRRKRGLRYRIDKLSVYLPMIAMAVLALGTFWLARSVPPTVQDAPQRAPGSEPDYQLFDFVIRNYTPGGAMSSEIMGDVARHRPDTDTLEVEQVRIRAIGDDGRLTTASADTGTSNADGSELSLHGNAVVIQHALGALPRQEFRGEELQVWPEQERVRSDKPVVLLRGQDRMTGDQLDYDKRQQRMDLSGRVRSTIQPAPSAPSAPAP